MAKFDNGDFVKVSGSERVYIVDKLLHTQKQTIPVAADLEIYRVLDDEAGFMDTQCELWRFAHMIGVAEDD